MPVVVLAARRAGNTGLDTVVATSDHSDDDVLAEAVTAAGISVARGSLHDPLARFVQATADLADEDVVVRLTADNVFPDGALVGYLAGLVTAAASYARIGGSDAIPVPYGVSAEAFLVSVLRAADRKATTHFEREHVTPWVRAHAGDHLVDAPECNDGWRGLRATIDTFDDFVQVARVFNSVDDPVRVSWSELSHRLAAVSQAAPRDWLASRKRNVLRQSPVVLGTVQLGLPYGAANADGMPDPDQSRAVLAAAAAAGISHLDSARAYGESEVRIGEGLRRGLSEHLQVVTKVRPLDDVPMDATTGWGRAAAEASIAESLRALGRDSLAGLLTHRALDWRKPGVRDALVAARDAGTAQIIGVSLSSPDELLDLIEDPDLGYVQLPFNLLDRRWLADDVQAALAARHGLVVTVRSVYLQGLLAAGIDARWPSNAGLDVRQFVDALDELVEDLGRCSRADLALAYVLGQPWVTSVVVGAETPAQVVDTATLARRPPLTTAEQELVRARLPEAPLDLIDPSRWMSA